MTKSRSGSSSAGGKRSPLADRRVLLLLVVVVLGGGFYGYQWFSAAQSKAADRAGVLRDAAEELNKEAPDLDVLSKLMAQVSRLPDADTAPDLLAVRAEVELLRGRPDRADRLFGSIASLPTASSAQQRLGARILLRKHAAGISNAADARGALLQVVSMAENAYVDGANVGDLFRCWQAHKRMWSEEGAVSCEQRLRTDHSGTREQRLVELLGRFHPGNDGNAVVALANEFEVVPSELRVMEALVTLQRDQVAEALAMVEKALNLAPGVPMVRYGNAIVLHACADGHPAGSPDRIAFVRRRDQQLDWLEARAPADEPQRQKWTAMRQVQ